MKIHLYLCNLLRKITGRNQQEKPKDIIRFLDNRDTTSQMPAPKKLTIEERLRCARSLSDYNASVQCSGGQVQNWWEYSPLPSLDVSDHSLPNYKS